jgi:signal transduction histidine kinase/ligand-binding sensor domain-containing protein
MAAVALEPATPLSRLGRQAWTMENGLPQNTVPVLLQSRDGFLWAGTELGLARFDGVSFRIFDHATEPAFPDAEIRCLLDGGDSGVWIGTGDGLVRWKAGKATRFTTGDGLPSNAIQGLAQPSDGAIWIWTQGGLARWSAEKLQTVDGENGLPGSEINSIAADRSGGIWVGTGQGAAVYRNGHWQAGPKAEPNATGLKDSDRTAHVKAAANGDVLIAGSAGVFLEHDGRIAKTLGREMLPADGVSFLEELPDGTVAAASKSTVVLGAAGRMLGRFTVAKELPGSRIEAMYADREGCLWIGTSHGLARISIDGRRGKEAVVHLLPASDPLASNAVISLLEDREGDLFAGTETGGLHILREARFRIVGVNDGLSSDATTAVVQDAGRTLWIGTRNNGLSRLSEAPDGALTASALTTADGLPSNVILSLAAGSGGEMWIGTPDGLGQYKDGRLRSYSSADGLPDDFIRSLLVAPDGSVWIGTRRGLTHMANGSFHNFTHSDGLGSDLVGALERAADGDLWIATLNGLTRLHDGHLRNYTTADGLSSNVITALSATADGTIWVGTQNAGLNLWDGQRFLAANGGGALPLAIHSIVPDDQEHLWLASDNGLTRVDAMLLSGCAHAGRCSEANAHVAHFTTADGLRSRETSSNSHPTSVKASDGRLWFTTPRGVIAVDPGHFAELPGPPPVAIERFSVDDHDVSDSGELRIGAGAMRFQFDYVGLSLAEPQKVRYRYMLQGFDHGWTEAGARRTAYYTNISPGDYKFCVQAAFGEEGFADAGGACELEPHLATPVGLGGVRQASLQFLLMPHYYQTLWFRALAVLAAGALVIWVVRRRVLRVEREFGAVMAERNRIAREIHDTLAQGYVGISLQLELLGELLRHNRAEAAQKHLALTQDMVREGLDDARRSIWALRSQDSGDDTLPIRLRRAVEQAGDGELTARFDVHGAYRPLASDVEQEMLRIAQEAIHNVKKHAGAGHLNVRLEYDERGVELMVEDDGRGFAPYGADSEGAGSTKGGPMEPEQLEGHYGLTGMRERSELIRGTIRITSQPGSGTAVRLSVPG